MKYVHLYTGPDGKSHFKDNEIELKDFAKGRKKSETIKATGISFNVTDAEYNYDWHNAPRRQFIITVEGEFEILASDGTSRRIRTGDIVLADDKTGQGHISRTVGDKLRKSIIVTLE
ncbi:MAG: hypothetical protein HYX79_01520 [Chloroflexi bacterium]|nr:hypothetical protein [Chloroflexota bacterium]